jgi:hypothetical protein
MPRQGFGAAGKQQARGFTGYDGQKDSRLDPTESAGPKLWRQVVIVMPANLGRLLLQPPAQGFQQRHASGSIRLRAREFLIAVIGPQLMNFY